MPVAPTPVPDESTVLGRSIRLLGAFRPGDDVLTLAEIHRRAGVPKPTAHRLLIQLAGWQLVERTPEGYRLGLRLFELGQLAPRPRGLREIVSPVLTRLHDLTGLTVHLAVLDDTEVVYVHKLDVPGAPPLASAIGGRMPAHCTAVGKAVLAHAPAAGTYAVLDKGLRRLTPRTLVTPSLFLDQLRAARQRGYSTDQEESAVGVSCIAAPILDADRRAVAAVSVTARAHDVRSPSTIRAVCAAASDASRRLDIAFRSGLSAIA
ncbi:IclR family transcriptional regulator [Pseudonocardia yuanmonensis]|uniref:IclR family transcriptional regulator n=1 Tax=Pseudonocardia yuanmonensis TaxID=1095914 RepID=A0ABP8XGP6_9PSEU